MEYGAIDLHVRRSEIRIEQEDGTVVLSQRITTHRSEFERVFGQRPRMRILVESATDSEWVAQCLEAWGHEVIVADPNYLPMYGQRNRRVKTDKRDVAALAAACRLGIYRRASRVAAAQRQRRQELRVRRQLIQVRTRVINLVRSLVRQDGLRVPSGDSERFVARLDSLTLPPGLATVLAPLRAMLLALSSQLRDCDERIGVQVAADPVAQRLMTAPGTGAVTALTFLAVLDTPERFDGDARRASAFLGLVPSEDSSAERQHKGHITKSGPRELRSLLVQASWAIWRSRTAEAQPLRAWAQAVAARRGRRIAIVALARRLSRILFAMWRDDTDFKPRRRDAVAA